MEHRTRCQNVRICLIFVVLLLAVQYAGSSEFPMTTVDFTTGPDLTTGPTMTTGPDASTGPTGASTGPTGVSTGPTITTGGDITTGRGESTEVSTRDISTPPNDHPCNSNPCDSSGFQISCEQVGVDDFQCSCESGFFLQGTTGPCQDSNECLAGSTNNCDPQATCTNTDGSFTCTCNSGFTGNGVSCTDTNECTTNADNCSPQATCTNNVGSFTCTCNQGFSGNGVSCSDINECTTNADNCSPNAACSNNFGSFTCTCNQGFSGNGVSCTDINECTTNADNCSPNAACTNNAGSFTCTCNQGFVGNGVTCTADTDECALNTDNCSPQATCTNTLGGFTCNCNAGFNGNGVTCTDINECTANTDNCSPQATCNNNAGSFTCTCNQGFSGNGVSCSDINECTTNADNCSPNAACSNNFGSFTCTCNQGFSGNGVSCTDIDECSDETDNCSPQATCTNTPPGSFTCTCNQGFTGDGVTCTDINECTTANPCEQQCANSVGSFVCSCNAGFTVNPQDPTDCVAEAMCCPTSSSATVNSRLFTTSSGICVYYNPNALATFTNADSECASRTSTDSLSGGQLYTEPAAALDNGIRNFVDDLTTIPIDVFPDVYVNFRRTNNANPFRWGDTSSTLLSSSDGRWVSGSPRTTTGLDCGVLSETTSNEFGFNNVDCVTTRALLCTVTAVTCSTQGLRARLLLPITFINGQEATLTEALKKNGSKEQNETKELIHDTVKEKSGRDASVKVTHFESGSIIAFLEVNLTRANSIRTVEQLKEILLSGQTDENGNVILNDGKGNSLSIDPDRLTVEDREDIVCKADTCNNGGTCTFNSHLIHSECQCQTGFQGTKCEKTDDISSSVILLVVLTLVLFLLTFVSCCVCIIFVRRRKTLSEKNDIYPAEQPSAVSNHVPMQTLYKGVDSQLIMRNAFAQLDEEFQKRSSLPRVIRSRRVDEESVDSRSITSRSDIDGDEEDDYDIQTILDKKKMAHFEQVFYRANDRYPKASSLVDASSTTSSGTSIIKPPLSESGDSGKNREFETPYSADGTINN